MKVYKTKHVLNRGRGAAEMLPGHLFQPDSAAQRDELIKLGAIDEASDAETALFEKTSASSIKAPELEPQVPVQQNPPQEPATQLTKAERIKKLEDDNDRDQLNAIAAGSGVSEPDKMAKKGDVAKAIVEAEDKQAAAASDIGV